MGMKNPVYMDHNATTAVRPAVKDALIRALELTGNPSSVHGAGRGDYHDGDQAEDGDGHVEVQDALRHAQVLLRRHPEVHEVKR